MALQKPAENSAALQIAPGPLVGPVLSRLVGMMAARASCPVDRLENALLVADALAAHGPDHVLNGSLRLVITTAERSLELSVGPLRPDGGSALLAKSAIPGVGNVLERMAEVVSVAPDPEGKGEVLVLRIDFDGVDVASERLSSESNG
jgi:hypothetical protein